MPVVQFHLADDKHSVEQCEELMVKASELYSSVLGSPMERVRVFIQFHKPWAMATAGKPVSRGGAVAPYFCFIVLEGRSLDQRQALIEGFTDLIASVLGEEKQQVRGACWPVPPEDWGIGGKPASELRKDEISQRQQQVGRTP
jgi:4-oxalocrotonate tautomerase